LSSETTKIELSELQDSIKKAPNFGLA